MKILDVAERILSHTSDPLTPNEIWELAVKKGIDKELNSSGKTPWRSLAAQLYISVRDNPNSLFDKVGSHPTRFILKATPNKLIASNIPNESIVIKKNKKESFIEKDLHPFLVYFARNDLKCRTKTIKHNISTKKEFGEWVHPDIVGCYFPHEDWSTEVWDLSTCIGIVSVKLLSFELKRELTFANLRESFFQTVSNSTWANEAYLVAASISEEQDFMSELSRLSTSFGIGIIKLDIEDPDCSHILLPAKQRESLDMQTVEKLTMNPDFKEFITTVKIDISSKRVHSKEYDEVLSIEKLKSTIKTT
jgi:hypothetical protein